MNLAELIDDDDAECPLCLDTLSFDDLGFFPCTCGYQICRFCWHHIKANLNGRCPACRKLYDDAAVEYKPMKPEELKRLQAAKKQRDKEKKDADINARKHAANVRVRQRAQVHIQGMTTRIANEDTLASLKGPEQFGKHGKILKLFFSRRVHPPPGQPGAPTILQPSTYASTSSSNTHQPVNVYINYAHPSEAHACIAALDGTVTSDGHRLRATWGTTRYCPAYLRGVKCPNENCMQAHEPGEELESGTHPGPVGSNGMMQHSGYTHQGSSSNSHSLAYNGTRDGNANFRETREEMVSLKHAYKEQQSKEPPTGAPAALPATASWANKQAFQQQQASSTIEPPRPSSSSSHISHAQSTSISSRLPKAQNHPLPARPQSRTASVDLARTKTSSSTASGTERDASKGKETAVGKTPLAESSKPPSLSVGQDDLEETTIPQTSSSVQSVAVAPPRKQQQTQGAPPGLSSLPPGIPVPIPGRPLTPVSEFDRTLDTFGDGSGFAFNLSAANAAASPVKGKSKLHDGDEEHVHDSGHGSRNGSLDETAGRQATEPAQVADSNDENKESYRGPFDPFAFGDAVISGPPSRADSPVSGMTSSGRLDAPPGLSRATTTASSHDGQVPFAFRNAAPPGFEDAASRHRSRFGFARPSSTDRSSSAGMSHSGSNNGFSNGVSIPVSELFKGLTSGNPFGGAAAGAYNLPPGITGVNGGTSPIRPGSAHSSASGSHGFGMPPPGIFSPSAVNGHSSSSASTPALTGLPGSAASSIFASSSTLPPSSILPTSSSELPLPPPSSNTTGQDGAQDGPTKKKQSLSDLFPGLDLTASFSATSSLPPALVRSLGISLDNLDLNATGVGSGKPLPNFAPMQLGQGLSAASQPLPPRSAPGQQQQDNESLSNGHATTRRSASSSSSSSTGQNYGLNGGLPPGFGTSRQAQQAHAQNAQQAHQAHLAAQQAQAAAASAAAAQQQAQQHQHQHSQHQPHYQQHQGGHAHHAHQQQHYHGRPPSAASGGSKHSTDIMYGAGIGHATSPVAGMPGTPGPHYSNDASVGAGRFQDPAIVSYAGMNGFGHHPMYGSPYGMPGLDGAPSPNPSGAPIQPGTPGASQGQGNASTAGGSGNGNSQGNDFYNRYHPLPTPVQPQQTYNPYIPMGMGGIGPGGNVVNIPAGMSRMQAAQAMSPGAFSMLRR